MFCGNNLNEHDDSSDSHEAYRGQCLSTYGYIPIAISKFTQSTVLARRIINFILSGEGRGAFDKYHYFTCPEQAIAFIGDKKPVGGEYDVPKEWTQR